MYSLIVCLIEVRKVLTLVTLISTCFHIKAQVKWDGGAGDGLWNTPENWVGDVGPGPADDVILDNSMITGNYLVTLPSGTAAVTVRTLVIFPSAARSIEVRLPVSNTAVPGFTTTGSVYGLEIRSGGIFRNSSGASAGTPVEISDSIKVYDGGWYIHNSSRAHAANVAVLSRAPGTEQGTFEFDVPGGSGYTVSIAGRVYGNLILSAAAAGGSKSYTSTGTTAVSIHGHFRISPGTNYSLNFNGAFIVRGDFVHQGNVFDISGGLHSNTISLRKNVSLGGTITETGTGTPVVEFDGSGNQDITVAGAITQSVSIRLNNPAGLTLQSPLVIPYKLDLVKGNMRTSAANLLVMQHNSTCAGGSVNSFVEGPMRKAGNDDFDFPIGKQGNYAPASISGTGGMLTDEFEAEYFLASPGATFGYVIESPPMVRISGLEYWKLQRVNGTSSKRITLSVSTYSDATLLEKLLVARWDAGGSVWKNEGNTAYSGIATGTVTSSDIGLFGVFTIASTVTNQNPLPLAPISFNARRHNNMAALKWETDTSLSIQGFGVLRSGNGIHFRSIKFLPVIPGKKSYEFFEPLTAPGTYYYKIQVLDKNGDARESNARSITYYQSSVQLQIAATLAGQKISVTIKATKREMANVLVLNSEGRIVRKISTQVYDAPQNLSIDMSLLPTGVYYLTAVSNGVRTNTMKFLKLL